jgi:hypothetical protein
MSMREEHAGSARSDADGRCPEATCTAAAQRDREDRRCYYHAKIWDGLIERQPRKKGGAPREFLDAGGGRLVQIQ